MSDDVITQPLYHERKFNRRKAIDEGKVVELRDEMETWANQLYEQGYTQMYTWYDPEDFYDTVTLRVRRPR